MWPRTARLDAPRVVARIAEVTGVRLTVEGPCPGGQVGAAYVRWPDGRRGVLSEGHRPTGALLGLARAAGIPTARQELSALIDGAHIIVQQRLPGVPPVNPGPGVVAAMIDLNSRQAGLLADHRDTDPAALYLTTDGPGFCLHGPLAAHSDRAAHLLERIHRIGATTTATVTGDDLVHFDYHLGNVLTDGPRITGVVDWDGAARGDRHLDLVTLAFTVAGTHPHLTGVVQPYLSGLHLHRYAAYWAHMSLRQVDWSIRHYDRATADHWIDVAEAGFPH